MENLILLFEEYLLKAIERTEAILNLDLTESHKLDSFIENRERLLGIINQLSGQIDWTQAAEERRNYLSKQVDYIKKLDERLLVKLQEFREALKADIEKTVRQKENIKGYNLTDVK